MVHYNTKYASFSDATNYPDGLAVLSILIDVKYLITIYNGGAYFLKICFIFNLDRKER